ncbi:uncharacterized protein L969DRAFT_86183 [Mixia osmundae IAM 14324]|uniref:uncharacterized protein n=1 Tax=Mixia osmundae (strain CBS 9802 / IAM 14324 / JCM 22182 / KY 12970) TaxID=764103 RepID=UPI0004A55743|nr:uncharacterized protein L969DRAFT_86183 [Mixia osmundae IAM 14324]KEI40931.1 hypothetical protein L969DRAFT_86183 [Mixia osmundae IAM 14324]
MSKSAMLEAEHGPAIPCDALRYPAMLCDTLRCSAIPCDALRALPVFLSGRATGMQSESASAQRSMQ